MSEGRKSRNNAKYSSDRRDHLRATEFKPDLKGFYVAQSLGQKWSVFSKRTNTKVATFDKAKQAHRWIAERREQEKIARSTPDEQQK
jgi:hypothetical protein